MKVLIDGSVATDALGNPVAKLEVPSPRFRVEEFRSVEVTFGGTDAADETVNYQVVGWRKVVAAGGGACYVPELLAKGVVTLGSVVYTLTTLGAGTELWADTITNTLTTSPRDSIHSPADNSLGVLELDVSGLSWVTVDVDLGTAASVDVFVQGVKESLR